MTIYLVRHGLADHDSDPLDAGLSPLGHEQARATADALGHLSGARVIVSPLRRTLETAAPIAAALACEATVRVEVSEVFDPGTPVDERRAWLGPFMAGTWSQYRELHGWRRKVIDCLLETGLEASAAGHDLVVVSHYIAIGVAIGEALSDDRVVPVPMANCSITTMNAGHGGLTLVEAASTKHLAPEQVTGIGVAALGRALGR